MSSGDGRGIRENIKNFLSRVIRNHDLTDEDDIFDLGFVNSLFAVELVMFVEQEFNIQVEDTDLDMANFKSVAAIARLVERKRDGKV